MTCGAGPIFADDSIGTVRRSYGSQGGTKQVVRSRLEKVTDTMLALRLA